MLMSSVWIICTICSANGLFFRLNYGTSPYKNEHCAETYRAVPGIFSFFSRLQLWSHCAETIKRRHSINTATTVFHRTSLLPPLSPSSAVVLNHISSHFLIPLSDSSLIGTVPAARAVTRHFGHYNSYYMKYLTVDRWHQETIGACRPQRPSADWKCKTGKCRTK